MVEEANNNAATDAEQNVLSVMMTDEGELPQLLMMLTPEMFYDHRNKAVYEAIVYADKHNMPVDLVNVREALIKIDKEKAAGGADYLLELSNVAGDFARATLYAQIIVQKYMARNYILHIQELVNEAKTGKEDVADILSKTSDVLDDISHNVVINAGMKPISEYTEEAMKMAMSREERYKNGQVTGISTGIGPLDRMLSGFQNGGLYILAGRPASGKTSVMLHMAKAAAEAGEPVAIFSLEMTGVSLTDRLILSYKDGISYDYRRGNLTQEVMTAVANGVAALNQLPISLSEKPAVTIHYIRHVARRLHKEGKLRIIFIDYLQLMSTGGEQNRDRELGVITGAAKCLAKELDIPIVILSQLNRECEKRLDKRPELQDLRESGSIEQDADAVMFVYRPEVYGLSDGSGNKIKGVGKIIIAKQRDGSTGEAKFGYNKSLTQIWGVNEENIFQDKTPY